MAFPKQRIIKWVNQGVVFLHQGQRILMSFLPVLADYVQLGFFSLNQTSGVFASGFGDDNKGGHGQAASGIGNGNSGIASRRNDKALLSLLGMVLTQVANTANFE